MVSLELNHVRQVRVDGHAVVSAWHIVVVDVE